MNITKRVLRGGSWFDDRGGARADSRNFGYPNGRDGGLGFRVCRASPIKHKDKKHERG